MISNFSSQTVTVIFTNSQIHTLVFKSSLADKRREDPLVMETYKLRCNQRFPVSLIPEVFFLERS